MRLLDVHVGSTESVEEGEVASADEFKTVCSKLANSQMKFCPGLSPKEYERCNDVFRYDKKGVQIITHPFRRTLEREPVVT